MESLGMTENFWRDRSVFVTGATGFLGGWLVRSLVESGAQVVCLIRDWVPNSSFHRGPDTASVSVVTGDIVDCALIERILGEYEVDTVFHLAAQTTVGVANRNPSSTFESNIQGTWSVLEGCRRSPLVQQVIVASSDKAYGDQEILPYDEHTPLQGRHPYDVSKSCADLIAQSYATTYGLPVCITRCGNFYGGGDLNWSRIVPGTVRAVLRNQRPVIRSDGQYVRDYFYIEDGVRAYLMLAEKLAGDRSLAGEAFNFSNELQITVLDLAQRILQSMNSTLEPEVLNQASGEIRNQYLSAARAGARLGWTPSFTLDAGLDRTIAWYREFLHGI